MKWERPEQWRDEWRKGRMVFGPNWERIAEQKVAIAYHLQKLPYVFPIIGGQKVEQLKENIEALHIAMSAEQIKHIEDAMPFNPTWPNRMQKFNVLHNSGAIKCYENRTCELVKQRPDYKNAVNMGGAKGRWDEQTGKGWASSGRQGGWLKSQNEAEGQGGAGRDGGIEKQIEGGQRTVLSQQVVFPSSPHEHFNE
ncbi:hypothetical protein V8E53_012253 [Lactarius tabidus]